MEDYDADWEEFTAREIIGAVAQMALLAALIAALVYAPALALALGAGL